MAIPLSEAVVLGAIQGVTEFLPISSDGHLALAQLLWGADADLATTVVLHAGTLAATLLILRGRVWAALVETVRCVAHPSRLQASQGGRDAATVVLATLPTGIIGLGLKHSVEKWSSDQIVIGVCLLLSAVVVGSTRFARRGEADSPTYWGAVLVGVVQGTAVLPGLSRSAVTIAALLWLGLRAERAFELSFLMSLPAVLGAILLEGREAFGGQTPAMTLFIGTVVSFVVGIGALLFLRGVLKRGRLDLFAVYLVPLAIAVFAWGFARP